MRPGFSLKKQNEKEKIIIASTILKAYAKLEKLK
jgi:hypothetical protein